MTESDKLIIDEIIVLLDDLIDSFLGVIEKSRLIIIQNDLRGIRLKLND